MHALLILALSLAGSSRPAQWATPLTLKGADNLHKVNDSLYRSEQPTALGMRNLADSLGIRTVINLRAFHSDRKKIKGTRLNLREIEIDTWDIDDKEIVRALRVIRWEGKGPYLVHCLHGADRTGTVNAMYRMVFQGWSREEAIREMTQGGYRFHSVWKNILKYLKTVDVAAIKAAVEAPPSAR